MFYLGSNRNLLGDRSRTYLLPRCISRKHADLACINAETVCYLLKIFEINHISIDDRSSSREIFIRN